MGGEVLDTGSPRDLLQSKLIQHLTNASREQGRFALIEFNSNRPFNTVLPFGYHDAEAIEPDLADFPRSSGASPLALAIQLALGEFGQIAEAILCITDGESNSGPSIRDVIAELESTEEKRRKRSRLLIVGIGRFAIEHRIELVRLAELTGGAFVSVRTDAEARSSAIVSSLIDVGFGLLSNTTPMAFLASRASRYEIEIEQLAKRVAESVSRTEQVSASIPEQVETVARQTQAVAFQAQNVADQVSQLKNEISSVREAGGSLTLAVEKTDRKARAFSLANGFLLLGFGFLFVVAFFFLNAQYTAAIAEAESILEEVQTLRALREAPL